MKTVNLSKVTAVMLALFVSIATFAGGKDAFNASIQLNEDSNVTISLNGESPNTIEIKVFDNSGEMVTYKRLINSGNRVFKHKLSEFPDGIYSYEVVDGKEVVYSARIIKKCENSAEYHEVPSGTNASISKVSNEEVIVRLANNPDEKAKIRVSDEYGNLLYRRTYKDVESAKITCDISQFPEGNYDFRVYNGDELIAYRKVNK